MYRQKIKAGLLVLCFLGMYGWVSISGRYSTYLLPPLSMIGHTFLDLIASGLLWKHVSISLLRVFQGFSLAFLMAMTLALLVYYFPKKLQPFDWLIQFLRNVPPLSLIPLLIIWLGIHEAPKIILIVLASFFPMYLNMIKGFKSCDQQLLEVGKVFGLTSKEIFQKIVLPAAIPDILVGMRTSLGFAYRAIIAAEMIAASSGLGYMILFARSLSQTDVVMIGIVIIGSLGYLCDILFVRIANALFGEVAGNDWY